MLKVELLVVVLAGGIFSFFKL